MSEKDVTYRIGKGVGIIYILLALIFDILEMVLAFFAIGLVVNRIITLIEYGLFFILFKIKGVLFFKKKTYTKAGAELIPVIGSLPIFTYNVWEVIRDSRKEDSTKKEKEVKENVVREKRTIG
jgi:predicted tellurium resistance membrane protein TerC